MDLSNIIQTSLEGAFNTGSVVSTSSSQSIPETIILRSGAGDQITTSMSGSTSIQLPSNISTKDGPLLCQLDDNSYILIEGLDSMTTTTTTVTSTSPVKTIRTSPIKSPLAGVKQSNNSPLSAAIKLAQSPGTGKFTSTAAPSVTKGGSPIKTVPVGSSVTFTSSTAQPSSRPFIIMPSPPITPKPSSSTKDSCSTNTSQALPINLQTITPSTTSSKPLSNIIATTSAAQNSNAPVKYILIPQSKGNSKISIPSMTASVNSAMKTITLGPASFGGLNPQKLNLPIGTSLIPTNKAAIKPMVIKPNAMVIPPSKINLKVPPIHSAKKVQSSQVESTNLSESSSTEDSNITSSEIEQDCAERPKSPTFFDETVSDIHEICSEPTKSIITYSKVSPKVLGPDPTKEVTTKSSNFHTPRTSTFLSISSSASTNVIPVVSTTDSKNVSSRSVVPSLPLQFIVPSNTSLKPTPNAIQNRKRKAESKSILENKRMKPVQQTTKLLPSVGEAGVEGRMIREVIAPRLIAGPDKAIISTASSELKKLIARREILLKQLNTSCKAFGKVDYKLTISGSPINVSEIYQRIASFQQQFENDLMNLDWAVSAMHKLYSEMMPKDETRSTEDILKDLLGSELPDDPKAKYERLKASPKKPRVRTPKKPPKTVLFKGADCPSLQLEERKIPDKPNPLDGKFHCELCTKVFLKQISLAKHLEFDHPPSLELEKKMSSPRSPKLPHACKDCDKSFHSSVMLAIHRSKEHDSLDIQTISRRPTGESNIFSDDDFKSPSEDELKTRKISNKPSTSRNPRSGRKVKKPKRRTRAAANKVKSKALDDLNFLFDSEETLTSSPKNNPRSNWRETDLFDPDIPIECTDENPVIPLRALSDEVIDAYTYSSRHS